MSKTVLFLGYGRSQTNLHEMIEGKGWQVTAVDDAPASLHPYDLCLSFGYRSSIPKETLRTARRPPLNLHMGYLPYNRGSHPHFWSIYEGTPSGVTIHEIDEGTETGPIVFQKEVKFLPEEDTLSATYSRLFHEIEGLFEAHIDALLDGTYQAKPQRGRGSVHTVRDLPTTGIDWDIPIVELLEKIDKNHETTYVRDMRLVDEIQQVRTRNNVNWMDLLRVGLTHAPNETKEILNRINADDNKIAELLKALGQR